MWTLTCLPVVGTQSILGCSGFFKWCLALLEASVQVLRPTACTSLLYWLYCIHSLLCLELRLGPTQHKLNNSSLRWIIHWEQLCVMVHSKNFLTQFWDKPKHWVKISLKQLTQRLGLSIFDPTTQHFLECTVFCNGISSTFFHTLPFYLSLSSVFLLLSRSTCNKQENERRKHNHELHLFPKYFFLQS